MLYNISKQEFNENKDKIKAIHHYFFSGVYVPAGGVGGGGGLGAGAYPGITHFSMSQDKLSG